MPRQLKVFLSSPGDVGAERDAADGVLTALQRSVQWKSKFTFDIVRWDDKYAPALIDAKLPPQDAIDAELPLPSECDLVIVILWSRFGTPLQRKKPDGTRYLSGTESEFESALNGKGTLLVFKRTEKPRIEIDDKDFAAKQEQYGRVKAFFESFKNPDGTIRHAAYEYGKPEQFQELFEKLIEAALVKADGAAPQKEQYRELFGQLDTVGNYKDIHDQLHEMQHQCLECLNRNVDRLADDASRWDEVEEYGDTMREIESRLRELAVKFAAGELPLNVATLEECTRLWREAITPRDIAKLSECRKKMSVLLSQQPSFVTARLNRKVSGLLPKLTELGAPENTAARAKIQNLAKLAEAHDSWQKLDDLLRSVNPETQEFVYWWPNVELLTDTVIRTVTENRNTLFDAALEELKASTQAPNVTSIREGFRKLKRQTGLAFLRADTDLKKCCDELRRADGPYGFLRAQ